MLYLSLIHPFLETWPALIYLSFSGTIESQVILGNMNVTIYLLIVILDLFGVTFQDTVQHNNFNGYFLFSYCFLYRCFSINNLIQESLDYGARNNKIIKNQEINKFRSCSCNTSGRYWSNSGSCSPSILKLPSLKNTILSLINQT